VIAVFGALSIPLGVVLKDIAYQTYVTKTAKSTIEDYFGEDRSRIPLFNINFANDERTNIDAVVLSKRDVNDALFKSCPNVIEKPVVILARYFRYGTTFTSRLASTD
jgi:hypothetical protein